LKHLLAIESACRSFLRRALEPPFLCPTLSFPFATISQDISSIALVLGGYLPDDKPYRADMASRWCHWGVV